MRNYANRGSAEVEKSLRDLFNLLITLRLNQAESSIFEFAMTAELKK